MSSFNKVILLGNLVADPELRVTQNGHSIAKFTLAINRSFITKEGDQRDEVSYVSIDAFGKQADTISNYLSKGNPILVEGRLRQDRWETQQGEKRTKLVVALESFRFVGQKNDSSVDPVDKNLTKRTEKTNVELDEDIPF